ncbi:ferredoxin reductase [Nocardioides panacisoli]|uniref:ferredoxin reductase n=1 Tax=Nocardioides panacisoli TaxID=627624 RepID=UPI001C6347DB|nr:ferredoxin reductase [Nocardioides panacisoli]QYJ02948.1 ferredoxin reductase [Nocardioides panacisoli]
MSTTSATTRTAGPGLGATLRQRLRSVADAAVTPLDLDDVLDHFHPLRRNTDLRGRIVEVRRETADAATVVIKPGRDWAGHRPGQYVQVGIDVDGTRRFRSYSLTHGPRRDGHISITVKAIAGGIVSPHLVHRARPGQLVHLQQAAGDFVLGDPHPPKLLLVTAGSGITPVIGMLRNLFSPAEAPSLDITLLHVNATEPDSIFKDELRRHAAADRIRLIEHFDDRDGLLDVATLPTLVPDLAERTAYACGPAGLLDALEDYCAEHDLDLTTERFRAATVLTDGEGGTVSFAAAGDEVAVDGTTPILDAAEDAGVLMPSGCRMGICMGCVLPMTEGAVRDLRTGELTVAVPGETGPGGVPVQTCINTAAGDCHLDH